MYQKVVVRDSKEISECSKDSGLNIYFDEFVPGTICVGDHLTQNIEQIINDILAWNYDIARSTIRGKSIEELILRL